jgi:Na+-translocating ferredoxin:NAD+ oxidoreductase RnfD subunit
MQANTIENTAKPGFLSVWLKNNFQYIPPAFITLILLIGQVSFGILDSYVNVIVSIATSLIMEILLARFVLGAWKNLSSAYITGISVGILVRSNLLWPYVITAMLSIMSKYVLKYKGRHLWNPSNFGVSWMLFMAPLAVAGLGMQWGSNLLPMAVIWFLGLLIVYRAKKIHVTLTYVTCFVILAYIRSLITNDPFLSELAPLTGPMYQLFIFFMVTDPGVSVSGKKAQMLVVMLVAVVEFVLRLDSFIYAPFYALFIVGPIARFIDLKRNAPKTKAAVELAVGV